MFSFIPIFRGYRNLVILFTIIIVFLQSPGGIDLINYHRESEIGIFSFNFYQIKEFVSWFLIKISIYFSGLLNLHNPALMLGLGTYLSFLLIKKRYDIYPASLFLCLVNPILILLIMNVLRQYVSVIFLFVSILAIFKEDKKIFLLMTMLAFFSHNSSAFISIIIFMSFYLTKSKLFFVTIAIGVFIPFVSSYLNFGSEYNYQGENADNKFYGYFIVMIVIVMFTYIKLKLKSEADVRFYDYILKLGFLFLFFSILSYISSLPIWVINRFLVSFVGLMILCFHMKNIKTKNHIFIDTFFSIFSIIMLFLHTGANNMAFNNL